MKHKKLKFNSIRTKLIAGIMAICILPLLAIGIGSFMQSKSILYDKLTLTSSQTLSQINDSLNEYFSGLSETVTLTTNNYNLVNVETGNNIDYVQDLLMSVKDTKSELLSAYFGTATGKFVNAPEDVMPDGYDPTTRDWYLMAVEKQGETVITSPYQDASTGDNIVTIAKTVEKDGKVVGVVAVDCTLTALTQQIAEKKVGNTGYVYISNVDGTVLAHPQSDLINTTTQLSFWDEVKTQDSGFVKYTYEGQNKFGVYQTSAITGWKLVAVLDDSELTTDTSAILMTTLIIIIIMLVISSLLSIFLSSGIAKNIIKLKEVFAKASDGDLTVSITAATKDEFRDLAESFNKMIGNISDLMRNVTKSSQTVLETSTNLASMSSEVATSVGEVARAIEEVSHGAVNQAQDAQNGAFQMDSLSNKLDEINENSNEMDDISKSTKSLSSKGLSMVETLIKKSDKTRLSTDQVNHIVDDMYESTKQISAISDTLSSITNQTNLLSLNASIESARAGEAGKGFAVVAGEIRKLAEESHNSTEEIKQIIETIQSKSEIAVEAIQETKQVVEEQDIAVGQTKEIFSEILDAIDKMLIKVEEIRKSITITNDNKSSLVVAIENISAVSEETASASEEVTASTEEITAAMEEFTRFSTELQGMANQLESQIGRFKVL
ncbi:methyl-accepting chemotaxis protein [Lachnotalea glycerini]|uniref:Methyl-accepting chemotaxis protein n=1 Tax=Lachnotalea glycerini TaxID=1763509 RepID=A0A318EIE8_9FIRM|nr:methyl-accepting chemotaxis protein [Lachnotalea glycerini]PXV86806.1 methyl-accepting chemotaxis protein [Lachnotalea glycerini]